MSVPQIFLKSLVEPYGKRSQTQCHQNPRRELVGTKFRIESLGVILMVGNFHHFFRLVTQRKIRRNVGDIVTIFRNGCRWRYRGWATGNLRGR